MIDPKERLIFALDVADFKKAVWLLDQVEGRVGMIKVNSLALAHPEIIPMIHARKIKVWRDLKHYDIPGTVANFIKADLQEGVSMTTMHILGGKEIMEAAVEAKGESNLDILGITILTSYDQKSFNEMGFKGSIQDKVLELARKAEKAGLDGIVCSAQESAILNIELEREMLIVTPGIKPLWAVQRKDQARVTTPGYAIENGATHIVVGSAIHQSENPGEAADKIVAEIEQAYYNL